MTSAHMSGTVLSSASHKLISSSLQDREKLEMESYFRRNIPEDERMGTKFVFRQGSPLDPLALQMVAATKARSVILTADSSRSSADSDGQCLRAAVLLDELIDADGDRRDGLGPSIVFQVCWAGGMRVQFIGGIAVET